MSLTRDLDERLEICLLPHKGGGRASLIISYLPERAEDVDDALAAMPEGRVQAVLKPPRQGGPSLLRCCTAGLR